MGMVAPGDPGQRGPGLHRDMAVGFGRQHHDGFCGVDVGQDPRSILGRAFFEHHAVEFSQRLDLVLRIPGDALAAVADLVHQRTQRGEAFEGVGIVVLDHGDLRRGLAGNQLALVLLPVAYRGGLAEFSRSVVHHGGEDHVLFHSQVADADLGERLREALEYFPIRARFPRGIDRRRQGMDEGVHVGGVEVVLLVPGRRRQGDVGEQAGGAHAEVERDQKVELALGCRVVPGHLVRAAIGGTEFGVEYAVLRTQQMLEKVFGTLAGRSQQVGAPDEQIARPVVRMVRVFAAHAQAAVLQSLDHVVLGRQADGHGVARQMQRVGLQLRRRG
ncbi:hypothetical protein GALL_454660 [mine drainage metagenome]|uniref:Uncharacterized protein n=1 Tax=mine drainage metagenome TaxID=410659 RepID=A0A1J5PYL7_9ZZZZ